MNKAIGITTFLIVSLMLISGDLFPQSLGYSGGLCTGSYVDVYIMGGYPCGSANVSSQSGWYISPSPSSITYNYNNGYYNSIRIQWNSAGSKTIRASYSCSSSGSSGTTSDLNLTIASAVTPSVGLSLNTTNVCYGSGSITFTASATNGGGSPSYSYYVDDAIVYNGYAASYTYSTAGLSAGSHTAYVRMFSSLACTTPSSSAQSSTANFSVTGKASYTASVSGPGLVCSNTSSITINATVAGAVGNLSYEWFVNGSPSWGGNSLTTNATNGNTIYCKVYSDYWCVNSPVQTNTYTVSVTNSVDPTVSVQISPKLNFCPGENITFTASSSYINSSSTYSWYLNGNLVSVPNTSQSIVIPSSSSNIGGHYYPGSTVSVTVNGLSGTCLSSNSATGSTSAAGVYTLPDASASNQSICSGSATSISISNPNGVSGTTYSWVAAANNVTGSSNGTGSLIAQTLSSTNGTTNGTVTYTITPSANGCTGTPITATVTVKPIPNAAANNQTICSGQTSSISLTNPNGVSGTSFSWSATHSNATGGSSGSGSTIAQPLYAASSSNGTVTYTVTPAANGCSGAAIYPVVIVKPLPSAAASSQSICSGQSTAITITNPNSVSGTTFSWTAAHVNATGGSAGSGTNIAQQLTATASINGSVTYTITPSANGCSGSSISLIATVKPLPNASAPANHYLFSGSATSIAITNPNGVSGTSFNWTVSSSNTSGSSSGSGSLIQQVLTSVNGGTATYTITPVANGCNGTAVTSLATVYARPVITSTAARVSFESVILSTASGYDSYTWRNQSNTILGSGQSLNTVTPDQYSVTVTKMGATGISLPFILSDQFSGLDENYIVTYIALEDGITAGTILESLPIEKITQSVEYFDGLGRPLQTVITKGSTSRNDIVQPKSYDAFGRELRQYLPYTSGADGWLKTQLFNTAGNYKGIPRNFYSSAVKVAHDTIRPFSETVFENSPLNRPVKNYGPGEDWFANDKYVGSSYEVNVDGNALEGQEKIINWTLTQTTISNVIYDLVVQSGYWPSNSLHIKITTDEDNHQVREYTDKFGRVVVRKVLSSLPATTYDDSKWAITYYVYDDFNRLRIVLQPEFYNKISAYNAANTTNKNTYLANWAFRYSYDKRGRMATKQVPGAGLVYMVYDARDRLVLTQDGKQRSTTPQYWTFTKYDEFNRPILTGIKDTSTSPVLTQVQMQQVVDAFYDEAVTYGERYVGNATGNIHGYSNLAYPVYTSAGTTDPNHYLTVTYYDRYDFRDGWTDEFDYTNEALSETRNGKLYQQPALEFLRTKGQITGNKVKVMDGGVRGGYIWLNSINYYDDRYRIIQNISSNFIGGTDRTTTLFDFAGKVLKVETKHSTGLVTWKEIVGSALSGNKLYKSISGNGWGTAGAASVEQLPAGQDGWVEFTASETNTQRMVGLSDQNTNAQYTSIDFAFYLNTTGLYVFENGANKATIAGGYKGTERLRIRRTGTTIQYYRNSDLVYTSTTPSSSLLMADVAFNHSNATAINGRSSFSTHSDSITRRFEYDHAGRLLRTWHQVNAEPEILLAYNDYNELGQLIDKKLHSTAWTATDARQSVDYRYNIRGWMTRMNESDLSAGDAGDPYDYFGFELGYNDDLGLGNGSLYNGNISAMKWSSNLGLADSKMNGYVYSYDLMNRITDATFKVGTGSINSLAWAIPSGNAFSETGYTYDLNGNIKTLTRKGAGGVSVDILNYEYQTLNNTLTHSNRLLNVTDAGDDTKGFTELNTPDNDYVYDNNGNMTWDRNKGGEELLINGEFSDGSTGWVVTDTGARLTFANDTLKVALSSAAATLAQNNIIQPNMGYVVIVDMEKTSATGSLTVNVGGTNVTVSNTGKSILNVTAGTGKNVTVTFPANAFSGNINMIEVKGLVVVAYNFLNLPEKVTKGGDHYMNYYHDATGRKLTQEVFTSANVLTKRSDYAGEYFYENDTLKFIQHEEGRAVMLEPGAEYQYHLKDRLGNVRLTFTTKNEVEQTTATLETDSAAIEQSQYLRYENVRRVQSSLFDHTNGTTTGYSQRLNGSANEKFGLARSLSVMPGDTVRAEVFAKYVDQDDGNWTQALADFMAAVANGTAPAGTVIDGGGYSLSTSSFSFAGLLNTSGSSGVGPKAYLNYLVFDRDYNFILAKSGYQRLSDSPKERGQDVAHERLYAEIPITEAGYVYIYLSNENESIVDVFFDDFNVEHAKSPIVQMDNYYPFGLTFNSYQRENSISQDYKYNGKEEQNELSLGWLDYGARMYQPEIGRFFTQDRFAEKYYSMPPYQYAFNNPIRFVDINGDSVVANGANAQEAIASTVKEKHRGKLAFDAKGKLDPKSIKGTLFSGNARALKRLAKDEQTYEITLSDKVEYKDGEGNIQTLQMGESVTNEDGQTEINGLRGITLLPGSDPEVPNSTNDNVQIIINERLDKAGKAQYVGHEAYGHAFMYSRGKPSDHIVESTDQGFVDTNKPLIKQIKKRENESIKNSSY